MSQASSPEYRFLLGLLADGGWHDGLRIAREVERTIPSGPASRYGQTVSRSTDMDVLVRTGQRTRIRDLIGDGLSRGRFESDLNPIGKAGWSGAKAWRIRDTMAGWLSIGDLADELDLNTSVIRTWVRHDYIPYRHSRAGQVMFSPSDVAACKLVAKAYPGPSKHNWPAPPRSLWAEPEAPSTDGIGVECPHCAGPLSLNIAKAQ